MYGGPFCTEKYILYKKEQKYRNDGRGAFGFSMIF